MDFNLRIPFDRRYKFAEPLDLLIEGNRGETLPKVESMFKNLKKSNKIFNFYIVGDIVTKDFLANPFLKNFIKLCIIDEKTQRKRISINYEGIFGEIFEFKSPPGTIPKESWSLFENIIQSKKKILLNIIEGEEDLLVLPLILALPLNDNIKKFVFYGQPPITDAKIAIPQGIVVSEINEDIQNKVRNLLEIMEKF